jgi:hypothetical protein
MNSRVYRRLTGALAALWLLACSPALAQVNPPDGPSPQFSLPTVEDFMAALIADDTQLRARVAQLEQMRAEAEVERPTRLCWPRPIESDDVGEQRDHVR